MKNLILVYKILKSIINHPFNRREGWVHGIKRFIKWQIISSINNWEVIYPLTKNTYILAKKGMTGVTGNIYCGLLEFGDMMFLLHFLRPSDLFIDIGSNVGVYTILASGEVGSRTISIEPIYSTYKILNMNVKLNNIDSKVRLLNMAIDDSKGELIFTVNEDVTNHVLSDNESIGSIETQKVKVDSLNNICTNEIPILIKIDVEGFESNVINGASNLLSSSELRAVIIELNGSGSRYGFNDYSIHNKLLSYGFKCFSYDPYERKLISLTSYGNHNTIYLKDIEFIKNRILTSKKIEILNQLI